MATGNPDGPMLPATAASGDRRSCVVRCSLVSEDRIQCRADETEAVPWPGSLRDHRALERAGFLNGQRQGHNRPWGPQECCDQRIDDLLCTSVISIHRVRGGDGP